VYGTLFFLAWLVCVVVRSRQSESRPSVRRIN